MHRSTSDDSQAANATYVPAAWVLHESLIVLRDRQVRLGLVFGIEPLAVVSLQNVQLQQWRWRVR